MAIAPNSTFVYTRGEDTDIRKTFDKYRNQSNQETQS